MPLTIATWNVNSLKVRLPHLLDWLAQHAVDVVCLQETKLRNGVGEVKVLVQNGAVAKSDWSSWEPMPA